MAGTQHKKTVQIPVQVKPASKPKPAPEASQKWAIVAILVFTALIYCRALFNGITYDDDDFYILHNAYIRDFSWHGVKAIFSSFYSYNYHPLTTLVWLIEYKLFDLSPLPYHLLNVALHLLNTWLVYKLAARLSGKSITAIVVSVLFAVHPMHVESVAWLSELKDVLYTAFYLLALLVYLRYIETNHSAKHYVAVLLLFLLSLFAKSAAVTLPLLLLAIDVYKGRKITAATIVEKAPFFLLSILFGILAILSQRADGAMTDLSASYSIVSRLFLFTTSLATYFIKLVAPFNLCALYYYPNTNTLPWLYYLSLPFLFLLGAGAVYFARKNSAMKKEVVFGLWFFLIAISVMLQIITVGSNLIAERYTYVSYIGLFYIAGQWITYMVEQKKGQKAALWVMSVFLVFFSIQSWARIGVWKDTNTLFTDLVEKNPGNWHNSFVYEYWGDYKRDNNDASGALDDYNKSLSLHPQIAKVLGKRGQAYEQLGDMRSAIADYSKAIFLDPKQSRMYNYRGWAYFQAHDSKSAIADFNKAIALKPDYPECYNNRGWAYFQSGDMKSAMDDYNKAIAIAPGFDKPYYNRATIKIRTGDLAGAIDNYNALISMHPKDRVAYYNRGAVRYDMKDKNGACNDWQRAADLGSDEASKMIDQYCH